MCGVMGFVRTAKPNRLTNTMISELMAEISVRGTHASGFAAMTKTSFAMHKAPISTRSMVHTKAWKRMLAMEPKMLIGHARWATNGDPKVNDNNHPHVSPDGRWVIVHNGIIRDDVMVQQRTECDSEIVALLLGEMGFTRTVEVMNGFFRSSFAVIALDLKERKLHAFRNSGSPLVMIDFSKTFGGYFLASTPAILLDALKATLGTKKLKANVWSLKPGWHYSFPMGCEGSLDNLGMDRMTFKTAEPKPAPNAQLVFDSWSDYYKHYPEDGVNVRGSSYDEIMVNAREDWHE